MIAAMPPNISVSAFSASTVSSPVLSVVIPVHNEAERLPELLRRLILVLEETREPFEVIAVDDGSTDASYHVLQKLREGEPRLKLLRFARNFGKESAMSCGLHHARGHAVIIMDSDLQHPPEMLPAMVAEWRKGFQMVYALRQNRNTDGWLRRVLSRGFYWLFGKIAETKLPMGAQDFRLLDRAVVDAVNALPERNRFMKGLMSWVGFKTAGVPYTHDRRGGGQSFFSIARLFRFAFDGIASFSTVPLRVWSGAGVLISLVAFGYLTYLVLRTVIMGADLPGFPSLMGGILLMGGLQLLSLGVIGEYLGRVFTEVKARPLYILSESAGIENPNRMGQTPRIPE